MAGKGPDRWSPGIAIGRGVSGPMQAIGGLFAMSADAVRFIFRKPFQWREFLEQSWFVARVSLAPTLLVAIPFTVLVSFTLNILLRELGAADLSGAGAAFGAVTQVGPLVTVLIVAGAGGRMGKMLIEAVEADPRRAAAPAPIAAEHQARWQRPVIVAAGRLADAARPISARWSLSSSSRLRWIASATLVPSVART